MIASRLFSVSTRGIGLAVLAGWGLLPAVKGAQSFAYVANQRSGVSAYSINAGTGALTAVPGSPFAAGGSPIFVTVDPAGKFAYVANYFDNNVSGYTINAVTGALTPVAGSPFAAGVRPISIAVDPAGKFAWVANADIVTGNVSAYTINAATGALMPGAGSPFAAGSGPASITVDPRGKFAYVANFDGSNVSAYTINAATGALTPVGGSPFASGTAPASVTVDPTGKFAYAANKFSNNVSAYTINAATGALTAVPGSPFAAGSNPFSVTVDPAGKFAYVANQVDNDVSAYTINAATGALTPVAGSPFAAGGLPLSVTVDKTGKFVYVANDNSANVSAYTINAATGALTPVAGSPFAAVDFPISVVTATPPAATVPGISKAFSPATITAGTLTRLSFTINSTSLSAVTGASFTDPLPCGLLVASPNGLTGSCGGGTITAAAGTSTVSLSGGSIPANSFCTFSVNLVSTVSGGVCVNTTSPLVTSEFGTGLPATATLIQNARPVIVSRFPAAGATGVTISQVDVTFDRPMNAATLNSSSFTLRAAGSTSNVPGSVYVSGAAASLVLSAPLMLATTYTVTIAGTVTDTEGAALGTPATWTFTTPASSAPPAIVSRFPEPGPAGVTVSQVDVTFDRPMNAATFNSSTFTLRAAGATSNVTGSIIVFGAKVSLVPFARLAAGTTYTVTIAGTVTDANGVALGTPVTWTFTTLTAAAPPVIVSRFPAAGAIGATASQIDVTFNRPMNAATFNSSSFTLRAAGSTSNVPGRIYVSGAAVSLVLSTPLMPSTTYTVTIAGTVTDTNGVALGSPAIWTFTTATGSTPPAIVSRSPAPGTTGVSTASEVDVIFDREMNAATFNSSTFTLRAAGAGSNVTASIYVFAAAVSLVPSAPLAPATTYTVTIAGTVADANGIALGSPATWTFTTK